jgi:hypothetical protein
LNGDKFLEFLDHFIYHEINERLSSASALNHDSHIKISAISICRENDVIMLIFLPHNSHKLHPLIKFYNVVNSNWMFSNPGKPVSIYSVAHQSGIPKCFSVHPISSLDSALLLCGQLILVCS